MKISTLVNNYAEKSSPYMGQFVNHLPMGQLSLYFLTGDLEKVKNYSENYVRISSIDPFELVGPKVNSLDNVLGKRELYGDLLRYLEEEIDHENVEKYISYVLNSFPLGMSSGLFHTLIRLSFAVEGYKEDKEYLEEVKRALSYYVTGYREADLFSREIEGNEIISQMNCLLSDQEISKLRENQSSMGKTMKVLYESEKYMESGFIIKGYKEDKVNALLDLILPAFINSKNKGDILILHCITGLQALLVLEEYFSDFDTALDIMTTCIITHLMTVDNLDLTSVEDESEISFEDIISKGTNSSDVHTIKLTYSANKLFKDFPRKDLKIAANKRVANT